MYTTIVTLVNILNSQVANQANIIEWAAPVPAFGNPDISMIATLGLNPSNREFVDDNGRELKGQQRRFHTLRSLKIERWADADYYHLSKILYTCKNYFKINPYDRWFKRLEYIISGTGLSYYGEEAGVCHLDLIPYATERKWAKLTNSERLALFTCSGNALALMLKDSPIKVLILNGSSVVDAFETMIEIPLERQEIMSWELPRQSGIGVKGIAYRGAINRISEIDLDRELLILGFNHNLQSSYGVTNEVMSSIRSWITQSVELLDYEPRR